MVSNSPKVAVIGECMVELHGKPPNLIQGYAGDTLNTAVYLSRLLRSQAEVCYMTAVGADPFSDGMLALWKREGISCKNVLRVPERNPGLYMISVDRKGERSFQYWRGESAAKLMFECEGADANLTALAGFEWIYLSGISLAILSEPSRQKLFSSLRLARSKGAKVVFDNNYRPKLWESAIAARHVYSAMLDLCDIAMLTLDDELAMRPNEDWISLISRCAEHQVGEIVVKRGAQDCIVHTPKNQWRVPANQIDNIVDTTAAGDSFSAAYLAARILGADPEQSAKWGHQLAGEVIQHPGALIPNNKMPKLSI